MDEWLAVEPVKGYRSLVAAFSETDGGLVLDRLVHPYGEFKWKNGGSDDGLQQVPTARPILKDGRVVESSLEWSDPYCCGGPLEDRVDGFASVEHVWKCSCGFYLLVEPAFYPTVDGMGLRRGDSGGIVFMSAVAWKEYLLSRWVYSYHDVLMFVNVECEMSDLIVDHGLYYRTSQFRMVGLILDRMRFDDHVLQQAADRLTVAFHGLPVVVDNLRLLKEDM